jgi:DNA invertase Pin-like site-specific DNA recombinase
MTNADPLPPTVLDRKAVVYVRQSTQTQVQVHLESERRQYDLVEEARRHGFRNVEVIDDDLGRSASGTVARPGFEKLVAGLCAGEVGAVLCFDASRLARNGRDWHHLLELCGLVDARVIDLDGVYNPCRPNDRLLLGMKGSISEFELGVLRSRMLDAAQSKARRGELRISVPIGFVWHREIGLGLDPDCRVQEVTHGIFQRFRELGSARQVHLALKAQQVHFPRPSGGKRMTAFDWVPIRYRNVISVLKNPFYAGAYAYGKSVNRTQIVDGRARKTYGHYRPLRDCEILLKNHHQGYIDWEEFERNQKQLAANAYGRKDGAKPRSSQRLRCGLTLRPTSRRACAWSGATLCGGWDNARLRRAHPTYLPSQGDRGPLHPVARLGECEELLRDGHGSNTRIRPCLHDHRLEPTPCNRLYPRQQFCRPCLARQRRNPPPVAGTLRLNDPPAMGQPPRRTAGYPLTQIQPWTSPARGNPGGPTCSPSTSF